MAFLENTSRGGRAVALTTSRLVKNFAASRPIPSPRRWSSTKRRAARTTGSTGTLRKEPRAFGRAGAGLPDGPARAREILGRSVEAARGAGQRRGGAGKGFAAPRGLERERDAARRERPSSRGAGPPGGGSLEDAGGRPGGVRRARADLEKRVGAGDRDDPAERGPARGGLRGEHRREGARAASAAPGPRGCPAGGLREDERARHRRQGAGPRIEARRNRPVARRPNRSGSSVSGKRDALRADPARAGGGRMPPRKAHVEGRPRRSPSRPRRSLGEVDVIGL